MSNDACEICCQVKAGRLTACLIHDFKDENKALCPTCNDTGRCTIIDDDGGVGTAVDFNSCYVCGKVGTTRCEHQWQHRCGLCGEPSEMDGLTETDRSSAIAAFRKICAMEKHDSPVYCIASEQISALLAFAPAHSNIGAGGGDEEGYVHPDVLASQSPEFQAEYTQRINNCEICCQVRAGKLTACLIHDFDDTEQTTNDDLNDHLVENIEQEYQEKKDLWPKCIFGKCEKPHSMFCEEHVSPKVRETDNDNNKKYELLLRACEALNNALEFAHDELKRKRDEIEMLRKRLKQSRERNGALLGVVEEIDTAKNVLDGALITLNADIEAARKRDEE